MLKHAIGRGDGRGQHLCFLYAIRGLAAVFLQTPTVVHQFEVLGWIQLREKSGNSLADSPPLQAPTQYLYMSCRHRVPHDRVVTQMFV